MQVRSNSKVAIIGCGLVGGKRAAGLPRGLLLYACDVDLARAHAIANRYEGCIATADVEQVLIDPNVLAVIVALTTRCSRPSRSKQSGMENILRWKSPAAFLFASCMK